MKSASRSRDAFAEMWDVGRERMARKEICEFVDVVERRRIGRRRTVTKSDLPTTNIDHSEMRNLPCLCEYADNDAVTTPLAEAIPNESSTRGCERIMSARFDQY